MPRKKSQSVVHDSATTRQNAENGIPTSGTVAVAEPESGKKSRKTKVRKPWQYWVVSVSEATRGFKMLYGPCGTRRQAEKAFEQTPHDDVHGIYRKAIAKILVLD